jgi:dolichyl-phosphate-mannose-protein mannosyltransferase
MLLGLAGYLSGYNGSFGFESGKKYPDNVNYGGMRIFSSLFGAFTVPLAYFTGVNLHFSKPTCILFATMVMLGMSKILHIDIQTNGGDIIDIALLNISRFILLDSMLLFFTALCVYCLSVFRNYQNTAYVTKLTSYITSMKL